MSKGNVRLDREHFYLYWTDYEEVALDYHREVNK